MKKLKRKYILIPIFTAVLSIVSFILMNFSPNQSKAKLYVDFINDINNKNIASVYVTGSPIITVRLKDGTEYVTDNPRTNDFKENLLKEGIKVSEERIPFTRNESIAISVFIASMLFLGVIMYKSSGITTKNILAVDAMNTSTAISTGYSFESMAGNEEAKESVKDIVDFLKDPHKYSLYGARMPKGIILYGEPGTGKTLLAKAVAGEANVPFYAVSGSDFIQVYVGVGASRIRQLFKKAKSHGKAVIFIDEIDAIGKKRDNSKAGGSDERDQTLNALLTEMSGFNEGNGIVVMAATNRLDMLDPALLRPGRFDRHVEITLPDIAAREKILALHLRNKPIKDIKIDEWAHKTVYFSGAKLESLVNEAAILACKEDTKFIENSHMDKAFSIVLAGHEKINRDYIKDEDKKITAFHEAGHALISLKMLPNEKVSKITIIPSTKGAGGYTLSIPQDKQYQNKAYLNKKIMVLLAGRAAEEIVLGENNITTGAYNDLKQCTAIASDMITQYGMGESLGLLNLYELSSSSSINQESIINECKNIINNLYENTKSILLEEKLLLEKISYLLIEKETLYYEDLIALL